MATVKTLVEKHYKKTDGTYRVRIKITHHGKQAYIATNVYVTDKDLDRNLEFKKSFFIYKTELINKLQEIIVENIKLFGYKITISHHKPLL